MGRSWGVFGGLGGVFVTNAPAESINLFPASASRKAGIIWSIFGAIRPEIFFQDLPKNPCKTPNQDPHTTPSDKSCVPSNAWSRYRLCCVSRPPHPNEQFARLSCESSGFTRCGEGTYPFVSVRCMVCCGFTSMVNWSSSHSVSVSGFIRSSSHVSV